jgi:aspartate aminotransferase
MNAAAMVQGQSTTCPCSVSQIAAAQALRGLQDVVRERRVILQRLRDDALQHLARLDCIACPPPEGGI